MIDDETFIFTDPADTIFISESEFVEIIGYPPLPPAVIVAETFMAENKDTVALVLGDVVAIHPSGTGVLLASADAGSKRAAGLVLIGGAVGVSVTVQTDGVIFLADWTNVIGALTLAAHATYFLASGSGGDMSTLPVAQGSGKILQALGESISPLVFEIEIQRPTQR